MNERTNEYVSKMNALASESMLIIRYSQNSPCTVFPQIQPRSRIEPGTTYPSKLKSLSLFKSRFQPSLDLNPGDYGP